MFQLSFAASLNLGWPQNGVLGNGLKELQELRKGKKFCVLVNPLQILTFNQKVVQGQLLESV